MKHSTTPRPGYFSGEEISRASPSRRPARCSHNPTDLTAVRVQNADGRFGKRSSLRDADDADDVWRKKTAAPVRLLRFLRDVASCSEKVGYNRDLEALLRELEGLGATVYSALRPMKMCGENWEDKTPVSLEVGYLTVVPTENVLEDMFVLRRCRLSF